MLAPPAGHAAMAALGILSMAGLGLLFRRLWRRSEEARFWAVGSLLALLPVCATFPTERLLLHAGIGMFALLGLLVADAGWLGGPATAGRTARLATGGLLAWHLGASLLLLPLRTATMLATGNLFGSGAIQAPADEGVADQTLVFVTGHDLTVSYTGLIREVEGVQPPPRRVALLGPWSTDVAVARTDSWTLELTPAGGYFANAMDRLFWSPEHPARPGRVVQMPDFTAEILAVTADGRPGTVRFRFREPLERGTYRFVAEIEGSVQEWTPPPPGRSATLPASMPTPIFRRLHFLDRKPTQ
jgi:hypothetical protein